MPRHKYFQQTEDTETFVFWIIRLHGPVKRMQIEKNFAVQPTLLAGWVKARASIIYGKGMEITWIYYLTMLRKCFANKLFSAIYSFPSPPFTFQHFSCSLSHSLDFLIFTIKHKYFYQLGKCKRKGNWVLCKEMRESLLPFSNFHSSVLTQIYFYSFSISFLFFFGAGWK